MLGKFTLALLFVVSAFANAGELFSEITPDNQDYEYYKKAINVDEEFIAQHLVNSEYNVYDSSVLLKPIRGSWPVYGRVVQLLDGPYFNPLNLVISVEQRLFYIHTDLNELVPRVSMARRWKYNNGEPPGIYLIIRGYRAGIRAGELIPLTIHMRVSDPMGIPLKSVEYYEDVHGR